MSKGVIVQFIIIFRALLGSRVRVRRFFGWPFLLVYLYSLPALSAQLALVAAEQANLALRPTQANLGAATASLTLQQAISAALSGNPELQSFAFRFRAQDARGSQAALRPALEASIEVANILGIGEMRGINAAEATFALSQVIELGGKRDARIAAAQAGRSVLDIERQARQLDVLAEVTRRFIAVAGHQERLRLARTAREIAEQTIAASEKRVTAAKSPHAELDRAHIALNRARLVERRAAVELETARKQLAATWGESQPVIAGQPLGRVEADLFTLPATGDYAELLARLAANPDFLRFASEARLRDAQLRLAATLRQSDLTLGGGVRHWQATQDNALVVSFSIPLFAGRRAESYVTEAQANRELVDAERQIAQVKAQATLYELHKALGQAVLEAETLKNDILPRAEEALKETEYAYERGRYSYLELVDTQREYLAMQAALIDASTNAHTLRAEIERLTNAPLTSDTP
jgi:cobalt-zinc-cadmium efflux system outer membrane protein